MTIIYYTWVDVESISQCQKKKKDLYNVFNILDLYGVRLFNYLQNIFFSFICEKTKFLFTS